MSLKKGKVLTAFCKEHKIDLDTLTDEQGQNLLTTKVFRDFHMKGGIK